MEREAGLTRNLPNKKLRHDVRRARQRAKRKANKEELLNLRRPDGKGTGKTDPTPFIAVLNIITRGKYLALGAGFVVRKPIKEIAKCRVNTCK